jgi:pantoate--beta-alanine ligase
MPADGSRAFVGLGSSDEDAGPRFARAVAALEASGFRVAALSRVVRGPYEEGGRPVAGEPPVANAVAEVRFSGTPEEALRRLLQIEAAEGRVRDGRRSRSLDLDLLSVEGARRNGAPPVLPHPRAADRAFVLAPWEEVAPLHEVPGTGARVAALAARLRARRPEAFRRLEASSPPASSPRRGRVDVLSDRAALARWREATRGTVGVVMTMGALHAGHAALVRRARAECDAVLATIFVNPLQFGPGEDLARYPRTPEADLVLLAEAGADAAYLPSAEDLYGSSFATAVVPEGPARGFEGALRPGHFRGVATVVTLLWLRSRPDRAYFGWKDAQQVAVLARMSADLGLPGELVACPTVREADGLALSSRNRYLSPDDRRRALALPRALDRLRDEVAKGAPGASAAADAASRMEIEGLSVDYVSIVDPWTMAPVEAGPTPALAVAAARVGGTRLLDNRFVARGAAR